VNRAVPCSGRHRRAAAAVVCAALTVSVALPVLAGESPAEASVVAPPANWVSALNELRADYGSPPVRVDPGLSTGAEQHSLYMAQNGRLDAAQDASLPKASAAGAAAAPVSLLAGPGHGGEDTPEEFVDLWARGAFTLLAMLQPEVDRIGYGQSMRGTADYAALNVYTGKAADRLTGAWPRSYPSARRTVEATTYTAAETPSPVTGCGPVPAGGWGLPVVVSYGPGARPTGVSATLTAAGAAVPACVLAAETSSDKAAVARLDDMNSVVLVPREPLRAGARYAGTVRSSRGEAAIRFSVSDAAGPTASPAGPRACPTGVVPPAGFRDVDPGSPHAQPIDCAAWWKLAQGTGPGTYSPAQHVTRAQMATFLARLADAAGRLPVKPPDAFADDDGTPHEAAINALAALGVVSGTGPGTYRPGQHVSRAQMAAFLVRLNDALAGTPLPAGAHPFTDVAGSAHEAAIAKAWAAGLASGTTPTTYAPDGLVRRDQMATFLMRVAGAQVRSGTIRAKG
jgi:hypothetical protein